MPDPATPLVSVVIPLCNAERFLPRSLDSAARQTRKDIEILLIDDGSTDGSGALCDRYSRGNNVFRVFHTANRGPSAARNTGIEAARGKFLFFMDADDTMEADTLESLTAAAEQKKCDLAIGDFKLINGMHNLREQNFFFPANRYFSRPELLGQITEYLATPRGASIFTNVWGKLYRRTVILEHGIRFREELRTWEDVVFNFDYLKYADSMCYLHRQFYHYDIHPELASTGTSVFRSPLGFRQVLQSIRSILADEGMASEEIDSRCRHAAAYLAVKTLIVCAVLRERGKCSADIDSAAIAGVIRSLTDDAEVQAGLRGYVRSPGESVLLPLLMRRKYYKLIGLACRFKARRILQKEKKNER